MPNTTPKHAKPATTWTAAVALFGFGFVGPVQAIDLSLPSNARLLADQHSGLDSYALPIGAHDGDGVPTRVTEGSVSRQAWRIDAQGLTTLQLLTPLRNQLEETGYQILFECSDRDCGGFDFRFDIDVMPAPGMHVDLFDYRFLSAQKGNDFISLLISRTANSAFVQIIQARPKGTAKPKTKGALPAATQSATIAVAPDLSGLPVVLQLESRGHAVLADLTFQTGSSSLGEGPFASLAELAEYLKTDTTRKVALVGHTDAVGALSGNIVLSKRRAASVLERLVSAFGVGRGQLAAEGMGYLAPIATNLTLEGREANRRVEVILLNTN
ncbi:MAG: cell envelope biogenesis protein OmpA [Rhodobacterales bacterium]|nr:MAG: cell envelope biogenesis protein OmpA [Rhodobacterales bacterium]